jgi:hypothetical protein
LRISAAHRPLSLLVAAFAFTAFTQPLRADAAGRETWLGLYFNGKKIGYTSLIVEQSDYRGKPAWKIISNSVTRIELLGNRVSQDVDVISYTDLSYAPLYQEYKISSNQSVLQLKAEYSSDRIVCRVDSGGGENVKEIKIPKGVKIIGDSTNVTQGQRIEVGKRATYHFLNPLTIDLDKTEVYVEAMETVTFEGKTFQAYRVNITGTMGKLTSWESTEGEPLKSEMPLGMVMFRESKAVAMDMESKLPAFTVTSKSKTVKPAAYMPPSDFAIATSIKPTTPIKNPRATRNLTIRISGIDNDALMISDSRQTYTAMSSPKNSFQIRVTAKSFSPEKSLSLPISNPEVSRYQKPAPYLELDNPELKQTAEEIRGTETNAYRVAAKIRAWVHAQMKPDFTIGVPRSSSEIFKRRRGVCRDYATLFAGLSRAAGIPTRVVGGITYGEGRFFYHAWVECWVGEWVPFDPTLDTDFVNATHIKFAQGDVTDMYNSVRIVGKVKIEVLQAN